MPAYSDPDILHMVEPLPGGSTERADSIRKNLLAILTAIEAEEARNRARIDAALPKHRLSATNLAHYLGLRKREVRPLQLELAALGLSSLGRCEGTCARHPAPAVRLACGPARGRPGRG
jgi:hypothetical protein